MEKKGSLAEKVSLRDIYDARDRIALSFGKLRSSLSGKTGLTPRPKIYRSILNWRTCILLAVSKSEVRTTPSLLPPKKREKGIYTASTGNFAQALCWSARKHGVTCDVIVPDTAPDAKLQPTLELGGHVTRVSTEAWARGVIVDRRFDGMTGTFIHPVVEPGVLAGNGTVGLEILEDLPDVDAVIVPWGGGSLTCGIALAVKRQRSKVKVFACEVESATPVKAALDAGEPVFCDFTPSFADGIGGKRILDEMWPLVQSLLDGSIVVTLQQVAEAMKLIVERNHVVAEGQEPRHWQQP